MKKDFISSFNQFIADHSLCNKKQRILVAVSSGIDSVVLTSLFKNSGYDIGIAHANFGLRGVESDDDERFARKMARSMKIPFFSKRFDTLNEKAIKKNSIQMVARDLRYAWLEEVRTSNAFTSIAVAHHLQDLTETVLINMLRGTGIAGLHGILPVHGNLIRPLLFATKDEITCYARKMKLIWRQDSSNEKDDYTRNLIRNHVLPVFKKINPSFEQTFGENATRLHQSELIIKEYISNLEETICYTNKNGEYILAKTFFELHPSGSAILYELLKPFNFTSSVINDICKAGHNQSGRRFFSETHQLLADRDEYIVSARVNKISNTIITNYNDHLELIQQDFILKIFPVQFHIELYETIKKNKNKTIAYADAEKVKFPFGVRLWETGDYFIPLGMKGRKKISDFYVDQKLSLTEKGRTWLLTDSEKILWVMGHRLDNRVSVSKKTKNCYRLEFIKL